MRPRLIEADAAGHPGRADLLNDADWGGDKAKSHAATLANAAGLKVLGQALEALLARWLASLDPNKAAAILRDMEAATTKAAARDDVDPLARDLYLLTVDKIGAAFYDRVRHRAEELRLGHRCRQP